MLLNLAPCFRKLRQWKGAGSGGSRTRNVPYPTQLNRVLLRCPSTTRFHSFLNHHPAHALHGILRSQPQCINMHVVVLLYGSCRLGMKCPIWCAMRRIRQLTFVIEVHLRAGLPPFATSISIDYCQGDFADTMSSNVDLMVRLICVTALDVLIAIKIHPVTELFPFVSEEFGEY
jgi:hypothetical protein